MHIQNPEGTWNESLSPSASPHVYLSLYVINTCAPSIFQIIEDFELIQFPSESFYFNHFDKLNTLFHFTPTPLCIFYNRAMSKIITVFGATGNQGGSVVQNILADSVLSKEFKIRGVTRDVNKPNAQKLTSMGVEMVTVRFNLAFMHVSYRSMNTKTPTITMYSNHCQICSNAECVIQ